MRLANDMVKSDIIPSKEFVYYGSGREFKHVEGHMKGEMDEIRDKNKSLARSRNLRRPRTRCS